MDTVKVKCISCFIGIWDGKMLDTDDLDKMDFIDNMIVEEK